MFQLIIYSFANQINKTLNGHVLASMLINSIFLGRITLSGQEDLTIVDERPPTRRKNRDTISFSQRLPLATPEEATEDSLDTLNSQARTRTNRALTGGLPDEF